MINITKFVALNTDQNSTQTLTFTQNEVNYLLMINCSFDDSFVLSKNAILDVNDLRASLSEDPAEAIHQIFQTTIKRMQLADQYSIFIGAFKGDGVHFISQGKAFKGYLYRNKKASDISPAPGQLSFGKFLPGDRAVILTTSLQPYLSQKSKLLFETPQDNLQQSLTALLPKEGLSLGVVVLDYLANKLDSPLEPVPPQTSVKKRSFKKLIFCILFLIIFVVGGWFFYQKTRPASLSSDNSQAAPVPQGGVTDTQVSVSNQSVDPALWLDLDLIKKGFKANRLSLSVGNILLLDPASKTLVSLDLSNKSHSILAGESKLGAATLSSIYSKLAFSYSPNKGIVRVSLEDNKATEIIKADKEWGEIGDIYGFAGNIYLLDKKDPSTGSGQVWKYQPVTSGYSDKKVYFNEGVKADLSGAKKLQIDSSVWILSNNDIQKFTQGNKDFFSVGGLETPLSNIKSFFVSSDTTNFYILDESRLVVTDKAGKALNIYQSDKLKDVTDLVVDEESKKVYLLIGSKILTFELK